ncbi:MAG: hypothetical protein HDR16_06365 [Lachnospiraceae bacterium]|nr:hypothetical protein [Lachnospiraceae bacterium]MBD5491734.1 hypothetical protein [Lachnospiraceae bacterium]
MRLPEQDQEQEQDKMEERESFFQKPIMTRILLGIIAVLFICILVLLLVMFVQSRQKPQDLQQNITDYAKQQENLEQTLEEEPQKEQTVEQGKPLETQIELTEDEEEDLKEELASVDDEKTAVVVDIEDESDEAYTKEFILKEAYPYFEANNQDAIWDLAHLKRYVKLSKGLEGTDDFYYQGDVDSEGKPNGTGLAIYEKNSYYFGQWSHGVRSGQGTWFRFYINQKNKTNAMGTYMSHSYSGVWANNLPNGQGAEHYDVDISTLTSTSRIIQNVVGNFKDGLYDGEMYANTVDYIGNVQEWDGIATEGVFALWRDMSAIGECAVWRYRDDHSICMDIDKSENQQQGIRELLK